MGGSAILAGLAGLGLWRGWSGWRLAAGLAAAWVAVLALVLSGTAASLAPGGARGWTLIGGILALLLGYRVLLARLHDRAAVAASSGVAPNPAAPSRTTPPRPAPPPLSDAELDRYARHIVLRELGGPGQRKLRAARVLVVGAGGLGAPICLYLAAAGVGEITIADDDEVSLSNLQRQILFRDRDIGRAKVDAAADAISALNPHVRVTRLARRITEADTELIGAHDLVLDGTDSFAVRAAVNRACVAAGVPLVAGSIAQWEGQVTIWDPARGAPCMACLFPEPPAPGLAPSCAEAGVVGALPGVIGSIMALEAIKLLADTGQPLRGRMLIFDGLWGETRTMTLHRAPDCPVCGPHDGPET